MSDSQLVGFTRHLSDIHCGSCHQAFQYEFATKGDPQPDATLSELRDIQCPRCKAIVRISVDLVFQNYKIAVVKTFAA